MDISVLPLLSKKTRAEIVVVDKKLVEEAYKEHKNPKRIYLRQGYKGWPRPPHFIPCECGCEEEIVIGEVILVVRWIEKAEYKMVFYASVQCQRRNFLEIMGRIVDRRIRAKIAKEKSE